MINREEKANIRNYVNGKIVAGEGIRVDLAGDQIVITATGRVTPSPASLARFEPTRVKALPPIPTSGYHTIIWQGSGAGGSGDSQRWEINADEQDEWTPCQYYTPLSGVPA